jgi:3-deoxy-D-manno-octulosonate 8-phosphate phosphatase (KDO 8-P phosphatase)
MEDLATRIQRIDWLLLDVDGVLTDGQIIYGDDNREIKAFHVRDGSAIKLWQQAGKQIAIISGRKSPVVERRAKELGISEIIQGSGNKLVALKELVAKTGINARQIAAMGDDLPDLPVLRNCGVGITVADGCAELREIADYVTQKPGGRGAVRDAIEWILKQQNRWDGLIRQYYEET